MVIAIVAVAVGLFGNSLRCMSASCSCPGLCKAVTLDCTDRFDSRCTSAAQACQGLTPVEYYNHFFTYLGTRW